MFTAFIENMEASHALYYAAFINGFSYVRLAALIESPVAASFIGAIAGTLMTILVRFTILMICPEHLLFLPITVLVLASYYNYQRHSSADPTVFGLFFGKGRAEASQKEALASDTKAGGPDRAK